MLDNVDQLEPGYYFLSDSRNIYDVKESKHYTLYILENLSTAASFVDFKLSGEIKNVKLNQKAYFRDPVVFDPPIVRSTITLKLITTIKSASQTLEENLNSHLFVFSNGDRWSSTVIKNKYCEGFKKFMHFNIDFSTNRQLMVYFAKVNNIKLWQGSKEGNLAEEQNEEVGFDIQANHSASSAKIHYGKRRADPFINIVWVDDYTKGVEFSTK
ncbi:hypothetical protein HK099_006685 [Clydaea vesicula]|uniref:Uncharacterized protein n=1 Tax=Clydaea vesicula TaxID=447962 RepID=A0AAD5XWU3_9FUNG|nr:hypothetical protein HK099_006685 [Clydaea vesicula]